MTKHTKADIARRHAANSLVAFASDGSEKGEAGQEGEGDKENNRGATATARAPLKMMKLRPRILCGVVTG